MTEPWSGCGVEISAEEDAMETAIVATMPSGVAGKVDHAQAIPGFNDILILQVDIGAQGLDLKPASQPVLKAKSRSSGFRRGEFALQTCGFQAVNMDACAAGLAHPGEVGICQNVAMRDQNMLDGTPGDATGEQAKVDFGPCTTATGVDKGYSAPFPKHKNTITEMFDNIKGEGTGG